MRRIRPNLARMVLVSFCAVPLAALAQSGAPRREQPAPEPPSAPPPASEPPLPAPEPPPTEAPPEAAVSTETSPAPAPAVPAPRAPVPAAAAEPETAAAKADDVAAGASESWRRIESPLTFEARLGFGLRPDSGLGFTDETTAGAELGLSLYFGLGERLAAGIALDRASLGRGTGLSGIDSVTAEYDVYSAMLGLRALPLRSDFVDLFVGFQLGAGVQTLTATGTSGTGSITAPARVFSCDASDTPALQLGGYLGARFMLAPRWGVSARLNGVGRRLSGEVLDDCAPGLGSLVSVGAGLGVGYDFEL